MGEGGGMDKGNVSPAKHATSQLHHDNHVLFCHICFWLSGK